MATFETATCSRCGGSGQYSYCQSYGTKCFKCAGSGKAYTGRALKAIAWLKAKRTIAAKDVKPGMRVKILGLTLQVQSVGESTSKWLNEETNEWMPYLEIKGTKYAACAFETTEGELIPATKAEVAAQVAEAVAYQNALPTGKK